MMMGEGIIMKLLCPPQWFGVARLNNMMFWIYEQWADRSDTAMFKDLQRAYWLGYDDDDDVMFSVGVVNCVYARRLRTWSYVHMLGCIPPNWFSEIFAWTGRRYRTCMWSGAKNTQQTIESQNVLYETEKATVLQVVAQQESH